MIRKYKPIDRYILYQKNFDKKFFALENILSKLGKDILKVIEFCLGKPRPKLMHKICPLQEISALGKS